MGNNERSHEVPANPHQLMEDLKYTLILINPHERLMDAK